MTLGDSDNNYGSLKPINSLIRFYSSLVIDSSNNKILIWNHFNDKLRIVCRPYRFHFTGGYRSHVQIRFALSVWNRNVITAVHRLAYVINLYIEVSSMISVEAAD